MDRDEGRSPADPLGTDFLSLGISFNIGPLHASIGVDIGSTESTHIRAPESVSQQIPATHQLHRQHPSIKVTRPPALAPLRKPALWELAQTATEPKVSTSRAARA
ncbi:MAG: hypothetical protein M3Y77_06580 [Actinomycetota bacterium]|nr:hypothetical protein [Actinomycetota bacterium]